MPLADTHTRISVQIPELLVDIKLSRDMHIDQLVGEIVVFLQEHVGADDKYKDAAEWLADPYAVWQLTTATGTHHAGSRSLSEAGVHDGAVVVLAKSTQRENYAPLFDDVAESIAHFQRLHFGEWVSANARLLAGVLTPVATLLLAAVLIFGVWRDLIGDVGQYTGAGTLAFFAVIAIVVAVAGRKSATESDLDHVAAGAITSGYIAIASAGLLLVPGDLSEFNLLLAGGVLAATALIVTTAARFPEDINYAAMSIGVVVAIAAAVAAMADATALGTAMGLATAAVLFFLISPRLSLVIGRVPMPWVPAIGESLGNGDSDDLTRIDANQRNEVIAAIINQERQVLTAHAGIVGMIWGALLIMAGTAVVAGASLENEEDATLIFVFYCAAALSMLFRGKSFGDAGIQRSWHIAAFGMFALFNMSAALSGGDHYDLAIVGIALLLAGAVAGCYLAIRVKVVYSPILHKMLELFEFVCFAAAPVLMVFILDLYSMVRGR